MFYVIFFGLPFLWCMWRIKLHSDKEFKFNFNEIHHGDFGWSILWVISIIMVLSTDHNILCYIESGIGLLLVIDDSVGHYKSAHGKEEKWILEYIFGGIIKKFYPKG